MKKTTRILLAFSLVLILSMAAGGTVFAEEVTLEGTVTWFDQEGLIMTLDTVDGEVLVYLPEGFDFTGIELLSELSLTGEWTGEGIFTATGVSAPDEGDDDAGDDDDAGEQRDNAFCTDKKDVNHPMAAGIAETYGVSEEEVMDLFCQGYSVGAIMLAFQTAELTGTDPTDALAQRDDGKGWGQIWKEAGLIGNEDEALPPGQAKKLENAEQEQDQDQDKDKKEKKDKKDNPGNGGTPPGQDKKNKP